MKLSEYKKKHNLSQLELSRLTGVSQATLSLFLAGERGLSLDSALRIHATLGIPMEDLQFVRKNGSEDN